MTPTVYKLRIPQERNFDHYLAYASKNLVQLFWQTKQIGSFPFQFNPLKLIQHDINTIPNNKLKSASLIKLHCQMYQIFLEQNHPQKFFSKP